MSVLSVGRHLESSYLEFFFNYDYLNFYQTAASNFLSFLLSIKSLFSFNDFLLSVKFTILIWKFGGVCMYCESEQLWVG